MAHRVARHDPLREEAHRRIMRIAVLLGRHTDAIRQYERCRTILDDELGTEPSPETTRLHQEILADRETGGSRTLAAPQPRCSTRTSPPRWSAATGRGPRWPPCSTGCSTAREPSP